MRELVAAVVPGGPAFVELLQRTWDDGDALLPIDTLLPRPAVDALLEALRPTIVIDDRGDRSRRPDGIPVDDGDALVLATSGSTGTPKGVVHTHASVAASAEATSAGVGVDPATDRWLCSLTVAHVAGLSVVTRALHTGTPLEILPAFDVDEVTAAATQRGATLTTLVPTALARIDPAIFRRIVVGGTAPPDDMPPNCLASYGLTETGSAIAYDGLPLGDAEIRIVDGEIGVRGSMLLRAYRDGTDPRTADGWFATGDAGELDAHGRLVVHGRTGDLIITGGENVWPGPVEAVLEQLDTVAEVAVVGRPDPEWGAVVTAVVVPADAANPPTLDELRAEVRAQLHPFAAPRSLELVHALPRTPLGKLRRSALADLDRTGPIGGPS